MLNIAKEGFAKTLCNVDRKLGEELCVEKAIKKGLPKNYIKLLSDYLDTKF
jgi:hypothetical protein